MVWLGLGLDVEAAVGEAGESPGDEAGDGSSLESVGRVLGGLLFAIDPTLAAALQVRCVEVLTGEGLPCFRQFDDGFRELRAGGPGFVDAGTGENVGGSGPFSDASKSVASEERLTVAAGFLERLRAPRAQCAAVQVLP